MTLNPHLLLFLVVMFFSACSEKPKISNYQQSIKEHRIKTNKEYAAEGSPLTDEDRKNFVSLNFYPTDSTYLVWADFALNDTVDTFRMTTTTERTMLMQEEGIATFNLNGTTNKLHVYYDVNRYLENEYKDLFIPFIDGTSGFETYGGGRYIEPDSIDVENNKILIDFNKCYNPYCSYNHKYSCPIPPRENGLEIKIEVGEKNFH
jgi:uncharacterized protein